MSKHEATGYSYSINYAKKTLTSSIATL